LFRDQAVTVSVSHIASLAVALTLIPMLSALGARVTRADVAPTRESMMSASEEDARGVLSLGRISQVYDRFVRRALARPKTTVSIGWALFAASILCIPLIGRSLIPPLTEGEFFFEVNLPQGASLAATDRVVAQLEAAAGEDVRVERNYSRVGSRLISGGISLNNTGENLGQINLVLKDKANDRLEEDAVNSLRKKFEAIPDVQAKFGRPSYFSMKTPIEVVLYGEDLETLRDYSLDLSRDLETIPGLVDVRSSLEAGNPELQVVFNRDQLAALHLDLGSMSSTLQNRVQGAVPTRYKEADRQIDVRIRNQESDRQSVDDVENLVLPGPNGAPIRLVSIADVRIDQGPAEIHRLQQQRAAVVSANLADRGLAAAVNDVRARLAKDPPPQGIAAELAGQQAEMATSFNSLRFALLLAVFLVYLVMAATFESFVHPLIVLFTIPLAIVGVVVGLLVTGTDISVMVLIGVILLIGIVVNNAIVLIDCVNRLRRAGVEKKEAVVRAGHIRLRPIMMSTLTAVLGLIPMAISWGEGSELRAPLAITVFWGLSIATLLTLVVLPAAYLVVPSRVTVETPDGPKE